MESLFSSHQRKAYRCYLAFFWLCGMCCGFLSFYAANKSVLPLMRGTPYVPVSIVRLLCVNLLPFLLSALAVFLSSPMLVLLVCFSKAFVFFFVSLGLCQAFSSAGWLVRFLLLFSDCLSIPVLYFFWLRRISPDHKNRFFEDIWTLLLLAALGSIHACVISPFLACLIEN